MTRPVNPADERVEARLDVLVQPSLAKRIRDLAALDQRPVSNWCRARLEEAVRRREKRARESSG